MFCGKRRWADNMRRRGAGTNIYPLLSDKPGKRVILFIFLERAETGQKYLPMQRSMTLQLCTVLCTRRHLSIQARKQNKSERDFITLQLIHYHGQVRQREDLLYVTSVCHAAYHATCHSLGSCCRGLPCVLSHAPNVCPAACSFHTSGQTQLLLNTPHLTAWRYSACDHRIHISCMFRYTKMYSMPTIALVFHFMPHGPFYRSLSVTMH